MTPFVPASRLYDVRSKTTIEHPAAQASDADVQRALEEREIRADGGADSSDTDRFVDPPEGFHKNPDCDLHYSVDLLSRASDDPGGHALIDVRLLESGSYEVSLNAGIFGNYGPEDYDHIIVPRGYIQHAVDLLAERSLESEGESA
ncbi:hypothetical protein OB955_09325 [Halobacteria archaeon AArc-m2/3/4]|uniref:Uncharacterized protein n=1 Tax=Natronoglomus mannanivorans TaxID=2979990 RepID=A0ABT2QDE1_9EURY|nr:hypothetical protein [Halobacteria archaeon AArc-m2/3/4]